MFTHIILISSSYMQGKRIALHYVQDKNTSLENIKNDIFKIRHLCGEDIQLAIHKISTENESWESVIKKDTFFSDIHLINILNDFITEVSKDRKLKAIDVAKFILSIKPYTNLGIQKMVYLCYADYLCNYNKKMFDDKIYAYPYGPVISSLYKNFKSYERNEIQNLDNEETIIIDNTEINAYLARVIFSKDGVEVAASLIETLKKYLNYSASQLVSITHRKNSPWDVIYDEKKFNQVISDKTIEDYHYIESV